MDNKKHQKDVAALKLDLKAVKAQCNTKWDSKPLDEMKELLVNERQR